MPLTYATIQNETRFVRLAFPKLGKMCVGGSAALSLRLSSAGVENYVALGSIVLRDKPLFNYTPMEWVDGSSWDGHAWCVVENRFIADVTLPDSLLTLPPSYDDVKAHLHGISSRKELIFAREGTLTAYGELLYIQEDVLPEARYDDAVNGLKYFNATKPTEI